MSESIGLATAKKLTSGSLRCLEVLTSDKARSATASLLADTSLNLGSIIPDSSRFVGSLVEKPLLIPLGSVESLPCDVSSHGCLGEVSLVTKIVVDFDWNEFGKVPSIPSPTTGANGNVASLLGFVTGDISIRDCWFVC